MVARIPGRKYAARPETNGLPGRTRSSLGARKVPSRVKKRRAKVCSLHERCRKRRIENVLPGHEALGLVAISPMRFDVIGPSKTRFALSLIIVAICAHWLAVRGVTKVWAEIRDVHSTKLALRCERGDHQLVP